MRPLPPGLQETLDTRTAFTPLVIVEASRLGQNPQIYQASSGRVTFDNRRTVFGDGEVVLSLTGADAEVSSQSLLTPFGTRIAIDLGIVSPSGVSASVPAGRFVVDGSESDVIDTEPAARIVTLKLIDLSKVIADYRFETPFTTPAGDLAAAVNAVVTDRTGIDPVLPTTGVAIGSRTFGLDPGIDPWEELTDLALGFGFWLFYGREGDLNLTQPSYSGVPRSISPLSLNSSFDHRPANVVVARGESTDSAVAPVQAIALDDDPASPTYAGTGPGSSPYGRVTRFYASPLLSTVGEAQAAADTILDRELVVAAAWSITRAWDPTVEPYDVLGVAATDPLILGVDAVTINIGGTTDLEVREL